ncbi:MAG: class I SAM-dependent methyltransferase [Acidimicrobiales bacterium]
MAGSVPFDRAVEYYDRTRALQPETRASVTELLRGELDARGRVLEIGVGTGRIALPLAEAGIPLWGVDLSRPMLGRLEEKAPGAGVRVAEADATRLPFTAGAFGAAIACHVLHLVPDWPSAVGELVRVVRPGGVLLLDLGGGPGGEWAEVTAMVARALGIDRPRPGLTSRADLDQLLDRRPRQLPPVVSRVLRPLGDTLEDLRRQHHAWTWQVEPGAMEEAVRTTREWAERRFGDLDRPRPVETVVTWHAYDL